MTPHERQRLYEQVENGLEGRMSVGQPFLYADPNPICAFLKGEVGNWFEPYEMKRDEGVLTIKWATKKRRLIIFAGIYGVGYLVSWQGKGSLEHASGCIEGITGILDLWAWLTGEWS